MDAASGPLHRFRLARFEWGAPARPITEWEAKCSVLPLHAGPLSLTLQSLRRRSHENSTSMEAPTRRKPIELHVGTCSRQNKTPSLRSKSDLPLVRLAHTSLDWIGFGLIMAMWGGESVAMPHATPMDLLTLAKQKRVFRHLGNEQWS